MRLFSLRFASLLASCPVLYVALGFTSCTPIPQDTGQKVRYEVVKVDSARGLAWPYDFLRAKDLRDHDYFEEAAYIYINLYPTMRDSVVHESIIMDSLARAVDVEHGAPYYISRAIATMAVHDPDVFDNKKQVLNQSEMKKRYDWTSKLLDDLASKGIR